jgi:hypothetical protein
MHRFQPRIYLVIRPEGATGPIVDLEREYYRNYIFPETIFTAVTAYQNQLVSGGTHYLRRHSLCPSLPHFSTFPLFPFADYQAEDRQ